jgi:hypothetical protein
VGAGIGTAGIGYALTDFAFQHPDELVHKTHKTVGLLVLVLVWLQVRPRMGMARRDLLARRRDQLRQPSVASRLAWVGDLAPSSHAHAQVLVGLSRPWATPARLKHRHIWDILHSTLGRVAMLLAVINVGIGIWLFGCHHGGEAP